MKLKETTLDQRLFAGVVCLIVFVFGFLIVGETHSKAEQYCNGASPFGLEETMLYLYVILATLGSGLGVLHLLSMVKFRKS